MELTRRQRRAAKKMVRLNGGPIWWRVGAGKTRIALKFFATIAKQFKFKPTFIVVCRREAFYDWQQEVKKCGLDWDTRIIDSESDLLANVFAKKTMMYLISHGMLGKLRLPLQSHAQMFHAIAYDEGFLYKNPTTEHCFAANRLSEAINRAIILSGSIMTARDHTDIFGQLYAINQHQTLAPNLTAFRSRFMHKFAIDPNAGNQRARWVNAKGSGKRIAEIIESRASIYFPDKRDREIREATIKIPSSRDQRRAFDELREFFEITADGRRLELKNAPSVIIKTQQVSDGFIQMEKDKPPVAIKSRKMAYLIEKVAELIACGERVVIWCAFIHTVDLILQSLQKNMPTVQVFAMSGKHKIDAAAWHKKGQVAVCTEASGSSVNHFSNCPYAIYYSMDVHWLHLQQSRGRNDRSDSRHKVCYYYYLQTEGSMDSFVYRTAMNSGKKEREFINEATRKEVERWLKKEMNS